MQVCKESAINCSGNFFPNGFEFLSNHRGVHRQATLPALCQDSKPQPCPVCFSPALAYNFYRRRNGFFFYYVFQISHKILSMVSSKLKTCSQGLGNLPQALMSTTACFSKGTWTGRTLLHRQVGATKSGLTHGGSTWRNLATSQVHKPASSLQCMRHWRFSVYEGLMCSNLDTEGRKEAGAGRTGRGRGAFLFLWRKV